MSTAVDSSWKYSWPNTADFNFNYSKLLEKPIAKPSGVPSASRIRVAVIGAGVAGLVTARELIRSDIATVDIFEATERIGGRTHSWPVHNQETMMELGAMRMPMFGHVSERNSVLAYYCDHFGIDLADFPDPGSPHCRTGIYINGGKGPDGRLDPPVVDIWEKDSSAPPEPYRSTDNKWQRFKFVFTTIASRLYNTDKWEGFWRGVAAEYWHLSFREFVRAPIEPNPNLHRLGKLGGLGMTPEEADLFYVIGGGDGGWGAFFEISALYPIRTLLCGFGQNHKLVIGKPGTQKAPLHDDSQPPNSFLLQFRGVQSVAECLYHDQIPEIRQSLHSSAHARLYLNTRASFIKRPKGEFEIELRCSSADSSNVLECERVVGKYDAVVMTPTTWALQESVSSQGFDSRPESLRMVRKSLNLSHWISSCKVFYPLRERYWETRDIPQALVTDTFIRDVYAYACGSDPGVLLASYTWEDDADKLISEDDEALGNRCLDKIDHILKKTNRLGENESIRDFIVQGAPPKVIHWRKLRDYRGCAKLYRARSWNDDYAVLSYNQRKSKDSGLYLAGEGYSVEGGWVEPALRMALDAVVNIVRNFGPGRGIAFTVLKPEDYPHYATEWTPDPGFPTIL